MEFERMSGLRRKMAVVEAALFLCAVLATSHATPKPAYMCTVKCSDITDQEKAYLG